MFQTIYIVLIFSTILFLYLHIYFHLKTSNDLEVYEIERPSKDKLEEIGDLRQPVVFQYHCPTALTRQSLSVAYGGFDIQLRNIGAPTTDTDPLYLPLVLNTAFQALDTDSESKFLIENNADFLVETALYKRLAAKDAFLRPSMVSKCMYDYQTASAHTKTPFRYDVNYRNYFYVSEGEIICKLAPPKSTRYLAEIKDYENQEFRSPVNPWQVQPQYSSEFNKVKCMDIVVKQGYIVFIPAYWWYSIDFGGRPTSVCVFKYRTYMNDLAVLPQTCMGILQRQNIKHKRAAIYKTPPTAEVAVVTEQQIKEKPADSLLLLPDIRQSLPSELQETLELQIANTASDNINASEMVHV